uniref:Uncharacterized protein n=1 Tax=Lophocladia kuetzingii TaxID=675577 RepID=A0A1Z1MNN8_9FLOR|nr:hypothetical protein [Lophocladia kuetzingii]ARW67678.1 hypothetical protein [Lophocladia kuetzingii]
MKYHSIYAIIFIEFYIPLIFITSSRFKSKSLMVFYFSF